jgi:hypothetical protein
VIGLLVPEPSIYAMLLSGLGLVAWRLRRPYSLFAVRPTPPGA